MESDNHYTRFHQVIYPSYVQHTAKLWNDDLAPDQPLFSVFVGAASAKPAIGETFIVNRAKAMRRILFRGCPVIVFAGL